MAPLIVKDIEWHQSEEFVFISAKINGIKGAKTTIVSSAEYLRVNFAPYLLEIFFNREVIDLASSCTIDEKMETIRFQLPKMNRGIEWESLQSDLTSLEKKTIKENAVTLNQKREGEKLQFKCKARYELGQMTVREQIRIDQEEQKRIATLKNKEGGKALKEFNEWKQRVNHDGGDVILENEIVQEGDIVYEDDIAHENDIIVEDEIKFDQKDVVPIRHPGQILINFTPREFLTPSRESMEPEEQEWLKKQAVAKKLSGFDDQDLRPEERDPSWLLQKGRSLMKSGTQLGALSAFSHGIKLAPKMHELYMERAETHLNSRNYCKSIEDSSQALELLTPKVAANATDRLRCHLIRAEGFLGIHMKKEGLLDFKEAFKLDPNSSKIQDSINNIEMTLNFASSDQDSDVCT